MAKQKPYTSPSPFRTDQLTEGDRYELSDGHPIYCAQTMRRYDADGILEAPGLLRNPVPVRALYDRDAAHEATLRNLLQRRGYDSLEAVQAEGRAEGQALAILAILEDRGLPVSDAQRRIVLSCRESEKLRRWLTQALRVDDAGALFE